MYIWPSGNFDIPDNLAWQLLNRGSMPRGSDQLFAVGHRRRKRPNPFLQNCQESITDSVHGLLTRGTAAFNINWQMSESTWDGVSTLTLDFRFSARGAEGESDVSIQPQREHLAAAINRQGWLVVLCPRVVAFGHVSPS